MQVHKIRLLVLTLLGLLWLAPSFWVGATLGRLPFRVPTLLWQQYNAAGLFTKRTAVWSDWQIEMRTAGSTEWQLVSMVDVSPMPASGYRQRLDRILGDTQSKQAGEDLRRRLAGWIARRLTQLSGQRIAGVRYVRRRWPTNTPGMIFAAGCWNSDPGLPATTEISIVGQYTIVNDNATKDLPKPRVPIPMPQPKIFRRQTAALLPDKV